MRCSPIFFFFVLLFWFFFFLLASTCVNAYGKAKEKELLPSFDRNKICHGWAMLFKRFFSLLFSFFFVIIHRSSFFYRMPTKNRREILKYNAWVPKQNPPLLDSWPMQQRSKMIIIIIIEKKANLTGGIVYVGFFFFHSIQLARMNYKSQTPFSYTNTDNGTIYSDFILFQMNLKPSRNFSTLLLFSCFTSVPVIFLRTSDG